MRYLLRLPGGVSPVTGAGNPLRRHIADVIFRQE
jgi:hypothetical protein